MAAHDIDWDTLRRRLSAAAELAAGGFEPSAEETRRVLEARARAAARPPASLDEAPRLEVLRFSLASETYAVETRFVREVCQLRELTPIPCTPPFVAGVMSLRGRIVTIVDLRRFFELPIIGLTELNRVLVLQGEGGELGVLADAIDGVSTVRLSDLQAGLPTLTGIRGQFLKGVSGQMLAVLDGGLLLMDSSVKVNEQVAADASPRSWKGSDLSTGRAPARSQVNK